jgi:hypothetical protein
MYFLDPDHSTFYAEFQNDPREEDQGSLVLSAYHVEKKSSGLARGEIPDDAFILVSGWDVGKWGIHWAVGAVAPGRKITIIEYGVQTVDAPTGEVAAGDRAAQGALLRAVELAVYDGLRRLRDKFIESPYHRASGDVMPLVGCLVDARYATRAVYQFCSENMPTWGPVMGRGSAPHQGRYYIPKDAQLSLDHCCYQTAAESGARIYVANTDAYKQMLHTGFLLPDDAPGGVALFEGETSKTHFAFARHITAEIQQEVGSGVYVWKPARGRADNHWLDACVYLEACISLLERRLPAIGIGLQGEPIRVRRQRRVTLALGDDR